MQKKIKGISSGNGIDYGVKQSAATLIDLFGAPQTRLIRLDRREYDMRSRFQQAMRAQF